MSQLSLFGEAYTPEATPRATRKPRRKRGEDVAVKEKPAGKDNEKSTSTILDSWQPEKQYYSIGEVASLFKVNTSHIRFWTKEFKLKVRTTKKGDRLYKAADIYELRTIYHLVKEKGFTLAGAKTRLKEEKRKAEESTSLRDSLTALKTQLSALREQLD